MPCIERALDVLVASGVGEDVVKHCRAVEDVAVRISALNPGINVSLVKAGALLHDVGRASTHGIRHGVVGAGMLFGLGCEKELVLIAERHIGAGLLADEAVALGLPRRDYMPLSLEEKVVAHADNLVGGDTYMGIRECLDRVRARLPARAVERLIALHFDVFPPVVVKTRLPAESELEVVKKFDALARVQTQEDRQVVEVSGFGAPEAAEKLRESMG